jgi:hypothetical protein
MDFTGTCGPTPAYTTFEIGTAFPTPWTATLIGWHFGWTADFYGNEYRSFGLAIGESTIVPLDVSLVKGIPVDKNQYHNLEDFITGFDLEIVVSGIVNFGGAINLPFGNGGAVEFGLSNPQIGFGITYTWMRKK